MRTPELSQAYLQENYIKQGKTRTQISAETGVSAQRIGVLLQKYNIKRYPAKRHGLCTHPLNTMWCGIKERCLNQNADNFKWYGGRGITICDEWKEFLPFYEWAINNGWQPGLTIDRIDVNKSYEPDNCRFIPMKKQFRNRRSNRRITVDGETHLQCEWEELLGLRKKILAKWRHVHGDEYMVNRLREEIRKHADQGNNG